MFKLNKKGFALVETLIVSVFVATVFTIMYTNFFPMFGEYERRERYDDVDSIYRTFVLKREKNQFTITIKSLLIVNFMLEFSMLNMKMKVMEHYYLMKL